MSGARPETPEELHMLAGEYVLGVLGSAEMRAVDRQATLDPQVARAIASWEQRLAPMLTAVLEVAPPDALWARIEHAKSLAPHERQDRKPPSLVTSTPSTMARPPAAPAWLRPAAARRVWPWRVATVASLALAAGMAAIVLIPSLAHRLSGPMLVARDVSLVAVLTQPESSGDTRQDAAPQMAADTGTARLVESRAGIPDLAPAAGRVAGFLAAAWPDGTMVLTAFAPLQVPGGKTLELWIQPPNATAPSSLGLLTAAGRQAILPTMPVNGTALMVSLEPPGGSPTGAPTGHVAYAGTLRQIRR
jgi:anti-sigma-K factor RskA